MKPGEQFKHPTRIKIISTAGSLAIYAEAPPMMITLAAGIAKGTIPGMASRDVVKSGRTVTKQRIKKSL